LTFAKPFRIAGGHYARVRIFHTGDRRGAIQPYDNRRFVFFLEWRVCLGCILYQQFIETTASRRPANAQARQHRQPIPKPSPSEEPFHAHADNVVLVVGSLSWTIAE
jgi:hypothetical protein